MRRQYRFLLKWLIIASVGAAVLNFTCVNFVQSILSGSIPSLSRLEMADLMTNYEDSLIFWAQNGFESKPQSSALKFSQRKDLKLIGAQVVFRHGARTPLHLLQNLDEVIYSKEQIESYLPSVSEVQIVRKVDGRNASEKEVLSAFDIGRDAETKLKSVDGVQAFTGQLTSVGEKQLYELGQKIRLELTDTDQSNLIPEVYDPTYVYCRSTFMNRTVRSARSFLAGFFSAKTGENKVQTNRPFEIEVHNFTQEDLFPNPRVSPIIKKCLSCSQLYDSLDDNHDMKRTRRVFLERTKILNSTYGFIELHDDIVSRIAHGFPVPDDLLELSKDFQMMSARELTLRGTSIGFENFLSACCTRFLDSIIKNFQSILHNYQNEQNSNKNNAYQKLFIYSGHDTTIIPLAMALEVFDMYWPPYASHILIKLYVSPNNSSEAYILVDYRGKPQILPNCSDYYCPLSTFLKNVQARTKTIKITDEI